MESTTSKQRPVAAQNSSSTSKPKASRQARHSHDGTSGSKTKAQSQPSRQVKPSRDKQNTVSAPEVQLLTFDELRVRADAHYNEAKEIEASAQTVALSTLPRMLGKALGKRLGKGSVSDVRDLFLEIDKNSDGLVQNIELRQLIRNTLHINASNKQIDELFNSWDADRSGGIDLNEISGACKMLLAESVQVDKEIAASQDMAAHVRARGDKYSEAAEAMHAVEKAERQLSVQYSVNSGMITQPATPPSPDSTVEVRRKSDPGMMPELARRLKELAEELAARPLEEQRESHGGDIEPVEPSDSFVQRRSFHMIDTDSSGSVSHEELKAALLQSVDEGIASNKRISKLIHTLVKNNDGELQYEEYKMLWQTDALDGMLAKASTQGEAAQTSTEGGAVRDDGSNEFRVGTYCMTTKTLVLRKEATLESDKVTDVRAGAGVTIMELAWPRGKVKVQGGDEAEGWISLVSKANGKPNVDVLGNAPTTTDATDTSEDNGDDDQQPLARSIGLAIEAKSIAKLPQMWDPKDKGTLTRQDWSTRLKEFGLFTSEEEVTNLFDEMLGEQQADQRTPGKKSGQKSGQKSDDELNVKRLVRTILTWASTAEEERKALRSKVVELRSKAKKLQVALNKIENESMLKRERRYEEDMKERIEKEKREEEERVAKEVAKNQAMALKEEKQKAFVRSVEMKRRSTNTSVPVFTNLAIGQPTPGNLNGFKSPVTMTSTPVSRNTENSAQKPIW